MNILLSWSDLDGRKLADGDRIESFVSTPDYRDDDPARLCVRVRLELGPGITWWKQVELTNFDRSRMGAAEVQDKNVAAEVLCQIFPPTQGARWMTLWKAKFAGVHTPMYDVTDLQHLKGKLLILRWTKD